MQTCSGVYVHSVRTLQQVQMRKRWRMSEFSCVDVLVERVMLFLLFHELDISGPFLLRCVASFVKNSYKLSKINEMLDQGNMHYLISCVVLL